jgi:hypothetical protein
MKARFNPLKPEAHLHNKYLVGTTKKTLHQYKQQLVSTVYRNNYCSPQSHTKHNTLCRQKAELHPITGRWYGHSVTVGL